MKIGVISGSHRKISESARTAKYMQNQLAILGMSTYEFYLSGNPLPFWDETVWAQGEVWHKTWLPVAKELQNCDGFVIVSPEWGGMVPAGLKNFFLLCTQKEVGHKPALIVCVSSTRSATYPVAELRSSSYKNCRICYIPEHLIIRDVESMLQGDVPVNADDSYIRQRAIYGLKLLIEYSKALKTVRAAQVIDAKNFPHGM